MTITNNQETKFPVLWVMMLGVMIAIGPLSIDMYLPAFPSIASMSVQLPNQCQRIFWDWCLGSCFMDHLAIVLGEYARYTWA